ncbi:UbiE/COQ5 family methyltransferase, putative [Cordyceps militaris CM01]|uniref:UbiE/COQ5 family methyltransferase, putative n=1 Tax=Cordyceps militaris (strain CM01) TaxID=983644 RepID=G3JLD5_CORMM|nr:UbiE/COQ5 family methyltransferase, putative [Cordyceps militaris CM01]EGX90509.1 UbiE/COQ5 family methyltransferase, putative [Cordyceps militaris CM01]
MSQNTDLAYETHFAGPLWLREGVGALYAKGEVHTGPFSEPLLRKAGLDKIPPKDQVDILDLCCGTGITTATLHKLFKEQGIQDNVNLTCGDLSAGQLQFLGRRIQENQWKNTKITKMDAQKTGLPDDSFDYITCVFGLMVIPDSQAALEECYRMVKPGGTVALTVWHKELWSDEVRDALCQLPGYPNWPESSDELINAWAQGPWSNLHYVRSMLHRRGFVDIELQTKSIMIEFNDAEDFYEVYDAFIEWVTDRYWTEEEKKICRPLVRAAIIRFLDGKYGKGKPFAIEKVGIMATAKAPLS